MEWFLKIPKILHVYWGGETLNYLRFMTIKTFMIHNPDWEIVFLYPKHISKNVTWDTTENRRSPVCTDFLPHLMSLPIIKKEIDFQDYNVSNAISEVHKSDFIRLIQLSTVGGLWSDMDIFYTKPMSSLYFNKPENKDIETFVCIGDYGHSIGFMMASQNNRLFEMLLDRGTKEFQPIYYQTLGAKLYNKYIPDMDAINMITPGMNISMDVVYPIVAGNENDIIKTDVQSIISSKMQMPIFPDKTIGLHWYAGHPQWFNFLTKTNGGINNVPQSMIGTLLQNIYET